MRVIGRLLVLLAIALPLSIAVIDGSASADPAVMKCMHWQDGMNVSPGVGNTPSDQVVSGHGRVYGCNKAGGGAQFSATLQMSGATCSNLAMRGSAQFEWSNGTHSSAFLSFDPASGAKFTISGSITGGEFAGLIVQSQLRFTAVYNGSGQSCSPSNLLQMLEFTNSRSLQLLTPTPSTTNPPLPPQTTNPRPSHPNPPPSVIVIRPRPRPPTVVIIERRQRRHVVFVERRRRRAIILVHRSFPTGTLAFTGSSGAAAVAGLIALLVGGMLVCLDPNRRQGFAALARRRPRRSLQVTIPRH
jgi:hypothetical protein